MCVFELYVFVDASRSLPQSLGCIGVRYGAQIQGHKAKQRGSEKRQGTYELSGVVLWLVKSSPLEFFFHVQ